MPGVLINWHYHRHYHSVTLASLRKACMLECRRSVAAIATGYTYIAILIITCHWLYVAILINTYGRIVSLLSNTPCT